MLPALSKRPGGAVARLATVTAAAALCVTVATAPSAVAASSRPTPTAVAGTSSAVPTALTAGRYIVMFKGAPAAGYTGGLPGFHRTQPVAGQRIQTTDRVVESYRAHLTDVHRAALSRASVPTSDVLYDYTVAFNGVAAQLTAAQATALNKDASVATLFKDTVSHLDTTYSPRFLGLTRKNGLWNSLGGDRLGGAGKGQIIGVIDSGIWPKNPEVQAPPLRKPVPGWNGRCQAGEAWKKSFCNSKLIGARYFDKAFGVANINRAEYFSARDYDGHGTHTSTTAAGHPANVTIDGRDFGQASGMAPGAHLAMYKVCWTDVNDKNGCAGGDLLKAVDTAVADGVDVINYSIGSGTESSPFSPIEVAFYFAARAGVFVSASAGNAGPDASTLDHPSPWETTVAASTFKVLEQVAQTGDGHRYVGASATGTLRATPAVLAGTIARAGVAPADAALCAPGSLRPKQARGKVVVCDRGTYDRVAKSLEVAAEGGVGMVLVNTSPNSLNADLHRIPTVHLDDVSGAALKGYVATAANPTIAIRPLKPGESTTKVPQVAEFSSRGPSIQTGGDVVKPDISAPGVDVLAGIAPVTDGGRNWDLESGTSMAAPHIAGIAALLLQAHPKWSPMMVKSALMTTARPTVGTRNPFEQGAGNVLPNPATDPGLVYNSTARNWVQFLKGLGYSPADWNMGFDHAAAIDPSDLNAASIGIGSLAGTQTVTRTVTNVTGKAETYKATVTGVAGVDVQVTPSTLRVPANGTASFTVTFTTTTAAALNQWATGALTWTSRAHTVRSPVTVQPVALAGPSSVTGSIAPDGSGSTDYTVSPGFAGTLGTQVYGLTAGDAQASTVLTDPNAWNPATPPVASPGLVAFPVTVAANTTLVKVEAKAATVTDDIDLFLYNASNQLVAYSATPSGDESVTIPGLAPGSYTAYVNGYTSATGSSDFTFTKWLVDDTDAGNLTVTPSAPTVAIATPQALTLNWTGLDPTKQYLGWVKYLDKDGNDAGLTVVAVG